MPDALPEERGRRAVIGRGCRECFGKGARHWNERKPFPESTSGGCRRVGDPRDEPHPPLALFRNGRLSARSQPQPLFVRQFELARIVEPDRRPGRFLLPDYGSSE
jgi:hypothetical protein